MDPHVCVEQVIVAVGGLWSVYYMASLHAPAVREAYLAPLEALVAHNRTPIYVTSTAGGRDYDDGLVRGGINDGVDIAKRRGWRILDRGGVHKVLADRVAANASMAPYLLNDGAHYTGLVYKELNKLLLSMILHGDGSRPWGDASYTPLPTPSVSSSPRP